MLSDQITLFNELIFAGLVTAFLYSSGYAFVGVIVKLGKINDPFIGLSIFQKINFRVLLGMGFTFIFFSVLSLFESTFVQISYTYLAIVISLSSYLLYKKLRSSKIFFNKRPTMGLNIFTILTLIVILITLLLSANLISGYYGSTNNDGGYHTFKIRIIIDNPISLITHSSQPYAAYTDVYPSLAHCLGASFVTLFEIPIQDIVTMFCAILPALICLALCSAIYTIFKNKLISLIGSAISGFLTLGYSWGPMAFNALPLLMSFFISATGLGLIYYFFESNNKGWIHYFIVGVIFVVALETYYVSFLIILFWILILFAAKFANLSFRIRSIRFHSIISREKTKMIVAFMIPAITILPYLVIFFATRNPATQGFPSDIPPGYFSSANEIIVNLIQQRVTFDWLLDVPATANFFSQFGSILSLSSLSIILLPAMLAVFILSKNKSKRYLLTSYSLVFGLFLLLMAFLTLGTNTSIGKFFLSFFDLERIWQHIFIPGIMLTSMAIFLAGYITYIGIKHLWKKTEDLSHHKRNRLLAAVIFFIMVFNVIAICSSSFFIEFETQYTAIAGSINTFHSIGQDDVQIMSWIKNNISPSSKILVSTGDSGQYITPVTGVQSIYSYDNRIYSLKYGTLISKLSVNPFNPEAIQSMLDYNISYVYIGSISTIFSLDASSACFNATLLRETPYFSLVKQIGNSSLFKFDQNKAITFSLTEARLEKRYFIEENHAINHVANLLNLTNYLDHSGFNSLNATQLADWMKTKIASGTAPDSCLIMIMGNVPDTIADSPSNNTLIRRYLDAGGRVTWVGDVPFFFQSRINGTATYWGPFGASSILGVDVKVWDFKSTVSIVTPQGLRWGMGLPDYSTSQRPATNETVTTVLAAVQGYASSWHKNFNQTYPNSGFIYYSYVDYDGASSLRNNDIVNLATIPYALEK
jgi:hypothetical protein